MIAPPYPPLVDLVGYVGEAGQRLAEIEASEGAAGNISMYCGWDVEPESMFPISEEITLPTSAVELEGKSFIVTGSGRRLREIQHNPGENLGVVTINPGGNTGTLFTSPMRLFEKVTSEFNSHLAGHLDQITQTGTNFHALVHAQPLYLVYLSHISRYQDTGYFSRHVLRWQPECIVNLPEGIGFLPFMLPGSPDLMNATVNAMRKHKIVVWAKHGIMARSSSSVKKACDVIEYAETGARYEYLNLTNHGIAEGLSHDEMRAICEAFGVKQTIF
jgi:rhamnulose-1-phosphate aldolase